MHSTKSALRKTTLEYRRLLPDPEFHGRNEALLQSLLAFLAGSSNTSIHVFLPIARNREPDVQPILPLLWKQQKTIVTSTTDFESKTLQHFILTPETRVEISTRGIPEPQAGEPFDIDHVDIILVPLVVADSQGNRIGYGGGYYDRLLSETKATKVGLSLSPPVDQIAQREDFDIPLDYLITPFKTYNYGQNNTRRK